MKWGKLGILLGLIAILMLAAACFPETPEGASWIMKDAEIQPIEIPEFSPSEKSTPAIQPIKIPQL